MRLIPVSWILKPFRTRSPASWGQPVARRGWSLRAPAHEPQPFPHRLMVLPRAGPDGLRRAQALIGATNPNQLWQILLHASDAALEGIPPELFFDDDVIWHRQHLNQAGHVAYASIALRGNDVYGLNYVADLVQRRSHHKAQAEARFRSWPELLLHAMIAFAQARGKRRVLSPRAESLFRRVESGDALADLIAVYDDAVRSSFQVEPAADWWVINLEVNRQRLLQPEPQVETRSLRRTICLGHDLERGWGHRASHPAFAERADLIGRAALPAMLEIEHEVGVRATYHVVANFLPEVKDAIARGRHALAFHSYDHDLKAPQLERCRQVDPRIEGYRPPQSRLTAELNDRNFCLHNFEWLACAAAALGTQVPIIENRVAKLPIAFDDYPLFTGAMSYDAWEAQALQRIEESEFTAFSLHDCYADYWLPHYRAFLNKVLKLAEPRTLPEVAAEVWLASAV